MSMSTRRHEECYECALQDVEPPQCDGHQEGPLACSKFTARRGWELRVLFDGSGAIAIDDPTGATMTFVTYDPDEKRIVRRNGPEFSGMTDFRKELREKLKELLDAVDRPWLHEVTRVKEEGQK